MSGAVCEGGEKVKGHWETLPPLRGRICEAGRMSRMPSAPGPKGRRLREQSPLKQAGEWCAEGEWWPRV
jgi:hypothetical protein